MLVPREGVIAKESVLIYGLYNSGKSAAWTSLAALYRATDTPGTFHVVETTKDASYVVLEPFDDWQKNVVVHEVSDWQSLQDTTDKILAVAEPHDWAVTEMIGNAHVWSRDEWFTAHRDGMSWEDFRASGQPAKDVQSHHWIEMDKIYRGWSTRWVQGFPGHKLATAQADVVNTAQGFSDNKQVRAMFERIGLKPISHKDTGYTFRSVLLAKQPSAGEYTLTTVDDPGREQLVAQPVAPLPLGIVDTWLCRIAGWSFT